MNKNTLKKMYAIFLLSALCAAKQTFAQDLDPENREILKVVLIAWKKSPVEICHMVMEFLQERPLEFLFIQVGKPKKVVAKRIVESLLKKEFSKNLAGQPLKPMSYEITTPLHSQNEIRLNLKEKTADEYFVTVKKEDPKIVCIRQKCTRTGTPPTKIKFQEDVYEILKSLYIQR
ncbi:hypothetical protein ACFLY6_02825 [Candidatus Dependentiae bacterium]